ncbi:hypothetical protein FGG08_002291 [Glutinoglossum americanum]|uniref:Rap-GAP domain-containing protein n=1 Tax=Glutinoglossum americanum TaxID=1670608 RepID=A0A9P8L1S9_9PEZI|nr:hypothetical protein FGG08_002291 [Glutinoglossum americanum]
MDRLKVPNSRDPLPPVVTNTRMHSQPGDTPQTPEPKNTLGLANALRTLGGRLRPGISASSPSVAAVSTHSPPAGSGFLQQRQSQVGDGAVRDFLGGPVNNDQLYLQLRPGQPLPGRVAAAEAFRHIVEDYSLSSIVRIWTAAKDLTDSQLPTEARRAGFDLLTACIKHSDPTPLERRQFFEAISTPCHADDFHLQLNALVELTNHGKDLTAFETLIVRTVNAWLNRWFHESMRARQARKRDKTSPDISGEETNLASLFSFVTDVVKFNFKAFREEDVIQLLSEVLQICKRTTSSADIRDSIIFIDAVITYGYIPRSSLQSCLEIFCGVYSRIKTFEQETWNAVSNLCKSHMAQNTIAVLLDILQAPSGQHDVNTNTVRGAVHLIGRLLLMNGGEGLPTVPFSTVLAALQKAMAVDSARLELDIAHTIYSIFSNDTVISVIISEDWTVALDVLVQCSRRTNETADGRPIDPQLSTPSLPNSRGSKEDLRVSTDLSQTLFQIISQLENLCSKTDFTQKDTVIDFFIRVHGHLPDSCAELVINHYSEEHLCYPSNREWLSNSSHLVDIFLKNSTRPATLRLKVVDEMKEVYQTVKDVCQLDVLNEFLLGTLSDLSEEQNVQVLEALVEFAVGVAVDTDEQLFSTIIDLFLECFSADQLTPPGSVSGSVSGPSTISYQPSITVASQSSSTPGNVATRGLVQIFLRTINTFADKAHRIYGELLRIAGSDTCDTDARLTAMKLLFRLRSDAGHAILIVQSTGTQSLSAALGRTPESMAKLQAAEEISQGRRSGIEDRNSNRLSRSASIGAPQAFASRTMSRIGNTASRSPKPLCNLWMCPDPGALPETPPREASPFLYSYADTSSGASTDLKTQQKIVLKTSVWLEHIVSILQRGGDWEIYSYVLVHLGSQLTNHSLFRSAIPCIKLLRNVVCEKIRSSGFADPPSPGLKKADVAVCLFHVLTMLVSYHEKFSKSEQDDIVRAFMLGIGSWERTAKCCIHGLSICCHELPLSITKSLNNILQKMSQIITQSHVAVHVLEFLSGLARMPSVYVNFTEADYRTVFGVCFRYLQYVRDQRSKEPATPSTRTSLMSTRYSGTMRDSTAPEVTSPGVPDDLPQYVFSLTYHVIIFWFMSLKLADRAKHISWITKNLVKIDADREAIAEQSQVTIDMMQRAAYSDSDETSPEPHFASESDGPVQKRSWLLGQSIITIETATRTGLSQITKRQPSATTHSILKIETSPPPRHQIPTSSESVQELNQNPRDEASRIAILPSHVFLQFMVPSSMMPESLRPIPLPDDDATNRALNSFDLNSTVDGHKVGVIYIGEGQATEQEILANVIGSSEYTTFVEGLGTLTKLEGAKFNTQGLDKVNNTDGEFTFCWRDRVTEIVFHVTTMMPTNHSHDPQCSGKKRHTGNDFVNIIFNDSGLPFRFDTFPSAFNYVNIVITPESRASFIAIRTRSYDEANRQFYRVQVMSKPGFPEISPAADTKIVSGKSLPMFVRLLALNASVFSLVWYNRDGGEHISSWRNRLREIERLRQKHTVVSAIPSPAFNSNYTVAGDRSSVATTTSVASAMRDAMQRENLSARRASATTFLSEQSHRSSVITSGIEVDSGYNEDGVVDA